MAKNLDIFDPELKTVLTKGSNLSAQAEEIVADAYNKLTAPQKARFSVIVETLRAEYEDNIDSVQLAIAALSTVLQISAMKHFVGVVNNDTIDAMSEEEVQALEYARKTYNDNVNAVLKNADTGQRQTSFLKELDDFVMKRHPDGSIEVKASARPKLKLGDVKVIDVEVTRGAASPVKTVDDQDSPGDDTTLL